MCVFFFNGIYCVPTRQRLVTADILEEMLTSRRSQKASEESFLSSYYVLYIAITTGDVHYVFSCMIYTWHVGYDTAVPVFFSSLFFTFFLPGWDGMGIYGVETSLVYIVR